MNAYRLLAGRSEGKGPLGKPRLRWVDNTEMYLREIGWGGMDWIDLAYERDQRKSLVKAKLCKMYRLGTLPYVTENVTR
jgi:hypothetical protein